MNSYDLFYLIVMPIAWFSSVWDTRRVIQMKSAKSFSLSNYAISLALVLSATLRSWFILYDPLFTLNGLVILLVNSFQLAVFWKWRNQ